MSLRETSILVFGAIGVIWYYVCLFTIGLRWLDANSDATSFRDFMSVSITTIGVSLATFVGMLLGLRGLSEEVRQDVDVAQAAAPNDEAGRVGAVKLQEVANTAAGSTLQWCAALLYLASLLIAMYFWYRTGNSTDPAITNLAKSLLGLIGGALAVVLNLRR